jgi:peroxiredoxin Q/BCP
MPAKTGSTVKDFSLPSTGGKTFTLSEAFGGTAGGRGRNAPVKTLVLYFYPKDNTPGCTTEGQQFRDLYDQLRKAGCDVAGISRDSLRSHENFKAKMEFPFELLSDEDEKACGLFAVIKMKKMYGREVRGIERSTFVLDSSRAIIREWRGVKVPGHAQEVLDFVKAL